MKHPSGKKPCPRHMGTMDFFYTEEFRPAKIPEKEDPQGISKEKKGK